ncbi:MAG: hypothetical protein ABW221_11355 [Vicinamibacteria bacterium]
MIRAAAVLLLPALLLPESAAAWPATLMERITRDARRLLPRSLGMLMSEREKEIFEAAERLPPELTQAVAADLVRGELQPATIALWEAQTDEAVRLLRAQKVSAGVVKLGALLRIPADLSDPVLSAGPEGYPAGVTQQYYAYIGANLTKIPVVIESKPALKLARKDLPAYWKGVFGRSQSQSAVIRTELFQRGRVVDHRTVDYRNPVFGVASLSYSRAVNAIAATWLAVWRDVRGDVTRMATPTPVKPRDPRDVWAPLGGLPTPTPVPTPEVRKP